VAMLNITTCLRTSRETVGSHNSAPTIKVAVVAPMERTAVLVSRSHPNTSASRQMSGVTNAKSPAATAPVSARDKLSDKRHGRLAATIPAKSTRLPVRTRAA
jgi:hypothetical protein